MGTTALQAWFPHLNFPVPVATNLNSSLHCLTYLLHLVDAMGCPIIFGLLLSEK